MTPYAVDASKPLGSWKTAWTTAKRQAGVECRMHDLRHGFVSKLAETQTPDAIIEALAGHLSAKMREHYSHIRQDAKRRAVAGPTHLKRYMQSADRVGGRVTPAVLPHHWTGRSASGGS